MEEKAPHVARKTRFTHETIRETFKTAGGLHKVTEKIILDRTSKGFDSTGQGLKNKSNQNIASQQEDVVGWWSWKGRCTSIRMATGLSDYPRM